MRSWFASLRRLRQFDEEGWVFWLSLAFLVLGIACRLHVYFLAFPIWRDEAALALNFSQRDFRGLVYMLDNLQLAPLLFLWLEKAVHQYLGDSAALLRLVPLLAGISALVLFARLARLALKPLPAALALGLLAISAAPTHLASMVKPYSLDLFLATLLLTLTLGYLRTPQHSARLAALALVIPFAVATSYPAAFIAGAVSLVLLPVVWRQGGWVGRGWFLAFNVLCGVAFLAHLQLVARQTLDPATPDVRPYMADFWQGAFPPWRPLPALHWLVRCHVGHLLSYPLAYNGGGLLGLLLCGVGGWTLYRQGQRRLLALCLLPFALNLVAAAMRRYPYAGDQRLEQHLLPGICLLLGSGLAEVLWKLPVRPIAQRRWILAVAGLFVVIALGGAAVDTLLPYHDAEAAWAANIADYLRREVRPEDQILLGQPECCTLDCIRWQLLPFAGQVRSLHQLDWTSLERTGGRLWFVEQKPREAPSPEEERSHDPLALVPSIAQHLGHILGRRHFVVRMPGPDEPPMRISLLLYARR